MLKGGLGTSKPKFYRNMAHQSIPQKVLRYSVWALYL